MTNLQQIADDIYSTENTKSHKDLVLNYEKYKEELDRFDYNESQEKYDLFLRLLSDYAIALAGIESYKKAIPHIEKALELFKADKEFDPQKIYNTKFYELLLWNRGKSNYYLENYSLAKLDFELLVKEYPDNFIYKKWLITTKNIKLHLIKNILWYGVVVSLFIETFLDKIIFEKLIVIYIGILGLLAVLTLEALVYYRKKKYFADEKI